jgi:uncharacterized protein YijF (DUF1287 family)
MGMKKKLYLFLAFAFLAVLAPCAFAFDDVKQGTKYFESIKKLESQEIVNSERTLFFPEEQLTRIEFVQMMYMADMFSDFCPYHPIRFTDTELHQWYTPGLRSAVLCGGVQGSNNEFRPGAEITYGEAATMIAKSFGAIEVSEPWYKGSLDFLVVKKVTLGKNHEEIVTRAEGAYLVASFLNGMVDFSGIELVRSARKQKGVVIAYDTGYYAGGYPPEHAGACTDVVERALREMGHDWKKMIDDDMRLNGWAYPSAYDGNINYRRVRNVKVYLDRHAQVLALNDLYFPGDIVTYDQIPGSLWHIAIVSDKKAADGTPLLIHNYARGVVENNLLHDWPAPKSGHYRLSF